MNTYLEEVPAPFSEQVKKVLENLYDFAFLQNNPLTQYLQVDTWGETAGQHLRRDIINAIEALSPGTTVAFSSPNARLYNVVNLHYIEGLTIQEIAYELGVSERQVYRHLRRGEQGIAAILWGKYQQTDEEAPRNASSVKSEIDRLKTSFQFVDIGEMVQRSQEAVMPLAQQKNVSVSLQVSPAPLTISTDAFIARQVLVHLFSHIIQQATTMHIALENNDHGTWLTLTYHPPESISPISEVTLQLIRRLKWQLTQTEGKFKITLQTSNPTIMVIDDNEGLFRLVERYLTGQNYHMLSTTDGKTGLRLIEETHPDLLILDVMIPGMDGWEILQRVRTQPDTYKIPVIICSVFNDPELAGSLGASYFLPKPLNRQALIEALHELHIL